MSEVKTPLKNKILNNVQKTPLRIPPSPLLQKLGYGTGAIVYKLERTKPDSLRSPWAIKKLSKKGRSNSELGHRLLLEASTLSRLNHPNVVGFRAFTVNNGNACLAMEQCTECLGNLIENRFDSDLGPFPSNIVQKVANDISQALKYLHEEALILHCDIKSYNVLIKNDFEICKLCDFGVCMELSKDGTVDKTKLKPGAEYLGSEVWLAPELRGVEEIITVKADIYAFGLTLWEMLALEPPPLIDNDDSDELENFQLHERPALPNFDFGDDYNLVLEVFYYCTNSNYQERPTANKLCQIFSS